MQFSKQDTALVKGVAILMMLAHHCFESPYRYAGYELNFFPFTESQTVEIASFFKICVALFAFLSGYGITKSLENTPRDGYAKQVCRRSFSLMSGFWFIFVLCIISAAIIMPSMLKVYSSPNAISIAMFVLYDLLGLSALFGTPTLLSTWWYMSLALIIIALMPALHCFYKKFGAIATFILTFLFCGVIKKAFNDDIVNFNMIRWLFTLELGMVSADKNLLVKIREFKIIKKCGAADYILKLVVYTAILFALGYGRQHMDYSISYIRDGLIPMFVIIYCYTVLSPVPGLRNVLQFLGKHSMNMFLSHTILRAYFLKDFLYGLKYSLLTFFVLLALSLILSVLIDLLKKFTGYDKLCAKIMSKI